MHSIHLRRVHIHLYKAPVQPAIRASFGLITERSLLLIAVEDREGYMGWGEVWTGFPPIGARYRAELLERLVAPLILDASFSGPTKIHEHLLESLLPVVRMAAESGPVFQSLAGLDCALWDLVARRAGKPLYQILGGKDSCAAIPVYASGIPPHIDETGLDGIRKQGFRAFKLKAGFDDATVLPDIARAGNTLHPGESMMIDANCGWNFDQAVAALQYLSSTALEWVEEPLGPECPAEQWKQLSLMSAHPLAAGENLFTRDSFESALDWLDVVQPDLGKWGGVSQVFPLAHHAIERGVRYCPHSFGSYVGAAHAAHVLAAVGGDGRLELDVNANPLRSASTSPLLKINDGFGYLIDQPGIGVDIRLEAISPFLCNTITVEGTGS